jgi:N-acetylated-alpha-linked acidic dipeptidase
VLDLERLQADSEQIVELNNQVAESVTPIWNVYAIIPGHIRDEVIILGNHRDAWGFGAADPSSGSAVVNEIVRGMGKLLKKGWKPARTIVVASWDAEEVRSFLAMIIS